MGGKLTLDDPAKELHEVDRNLARLWPVVAKKYDGELLTAIQEIRTELQDMEAVLLEAKPVRVRFALPVAFTREGKAVPMAYEIPVDRALRVPLVFYNAAGNPVAGPSGGAVSISDGTAASVSTDDVSVVITPTGAPGVSFTVAYSNGSLSTEDVEFSLIAGVDGGTTPTPTPTPTDDVTPVRVGMNLGAATMEPIGGAAPAPTPTPAPATDTPAPTPAAEVPAAPPADGSLPPAPENTPA